MLSILARSLLILPLLLLQMALPATSLARTILWSGYTWDVRPPSTATEPGPNDWSDSAANVSVEGSDLLLSIVKDSSGNWASSEVHNESHLGYGTYRWVVATDLSALDTNEVLGMFTYGGSDPSNNEIDIEASHWGSLSKPTGSVTVWQDANAGLSHEHDFRYSAHPPYVNQFTWAPGRIDYLITDATGATLFAWTVTSGVPTPSTEVPIINYWRSDHVAPAGVRTMRISSFAWAPLGQALPPVTALPATGSPPAPSGATGAVIGGTSSLPSTPRGAPVSRRARAALRCVIGPRAGDGHAGHAVTLTLSMQPIHFPFALYPRDGVLHWSASGASIVDLVIRRWVRGAGFVSVGSLRRHFRAGAGQIRLPHEVGGHAVGPGTYRVGLRSRLRSVRCAPRPFAFTLT